MLQAGFGSPSFRPADEGASEIDSQSSWKTIAFGPSESTCCKSAKDAHSGKSGRAKGKEQILVAIASQTPPLRLRWRSRRLYLNNSTSGVSIQRSAGDVFPRLHVARDGRRKLAC